MESDSKSDNIVVGPWDGSAKKPPPKPKSKKDKIQQDMFYIDNLSENIMVNLIHSMAEKEIDITDKEFIRSIGFLDECVKSIIYNDINYDHPLTELVKHLVGATKSKDHDKVFTSFRGDKMIEILEFINGDEDE